METFGVLNYVTYFIGAVFIILLPGPNSLYVLALSAQQGRRIGWTAVAGVLIGDSLLILATALGAVSILTAYPAIFMVIKYAGAGYLTYLGYRLITGAIKSWRQLDVQSLQDAVEIKRTTGRKAFRKTLFVSLLNPKAILFFLSFFAQFVDPEYAQPVVPLLILALTIQALSLIYLTVLIYAGTTLAKTFRKRNKVSAISGASVGVGFVAFAIKLALASAS
ncbi:leucine efflux protein LeuE [Psychromonas antarctica]|uniref:leucine efflux protein LeuE n=1 Tax=Psychromonas antarctica TaxID=67573 RepID=UPI001EE81FC0|nr:leucine efflux protein LeuE [Psychromonas antarctica]MCG6202668.1 leucine efflux protein LeuE [Psychromonas antarctica]